MARINAGKYRHIVTFQKLKEAKNLYGETSKNVDENWEDTITARVGIFPISGREYLTLEKDLRQGEVSHRIVSRYIKGINSKMRVKFGERIFDMISPPINTQERNEELVFFVKERDIYPVPQPIIEPEVPDIEEPEPIPEPELMVVSYSMPRTTLIDNINAQTLGTLVVWDRLGNFYMNDPTYLKYSFAVDSTMEFVDTFKLIRIEAKGYTNQIVLYITHEYKGTIKTTTHYNLIANNVVDFLNSIGVSAVLE